MPSELAAVPLEDVRQNILLARSFIAGMSQTEFSRDRKTVYAVVRCLEIISEASRRLPDEIKRRHPDIPWSNIAGAGNVYRHDYEDVADDMIWRTATEGLDSLLAAIENEIAGLPR